MEEEGGDDVFRSGRIRREGRKDGREESKEVAMKIGEKR